MNVLRWGVVKESFGDSIEVEKHFFSDYLPAEDLNSRFAHPALGNYPGVEVLGTIPQREIDVNPQINILDINLSKNYLESIV